MAQEIVEVEGHLIDSHILPGILDTVMAHDGRFEVQQLDVGTTAGDPSFARLLLAHRSSKRLESILQAVARLGAEPVERRPVTLKPAPRDGVFPEGFYVTTNLATSVYLGGRWVRVKNPQMDSGITVSESRRSARTVKMGDVRKGDRIVVGRQGVHVTPAARRRGPGEFGFMTSEVSTEKPKRVLVANVAAMLEQERTAGRPVLWVCGPALVHSGAGPLFEKLIASGYVQALFSGNALAVHDIECALMGTSLGVSMREGAVTRAGHENHLRSINTIRRAGGIRQAVRKDVLKSGIMHACVTHGVDFVLAGSIRDDGPLPDVITDAVRAQHAMRRRCRTVGLAVMLATLLHSVATGNMLPASTRVVCVDIQPAAVTKLADRGTAQALGIVTDVQPFLQSLLLELGIR